ncbi:MAG: SDR family oxidoreductase [Dehalococcoidia bacterium]|nr:SDR family oxidoreductase [Dehalococcoidia bacterium]
MGERLAGKIAVVTGAGRGIGRAEALALAGEGAKVMVNDLGVSIDGTGASALPADEVVAEIRKGGGEAMASYDSVATAKGADSIIKAAIDNFGRIDILVNNAGVLKTRMIFNMSDEEWDDVVRVHLYGHFYCTRAACRWFRQQRSGRILNTSSLAGLGVPGAVAYSAAKEGIVGLTRSVAREMARYNVTCNAIRPEALTRLAQVVQPKREEKQDRVQHKTEFMAEVASVGESLPEDVAPLVVCLASDEAAHINGRTFLVRRGEVALYSEPAPLKPARRDGTWTVDELARALSLMEMHDDLA